MLPIGELNKNKAGFSLIEILMVVIIIGIIMALAAPNYSKGYSRFQLKRTVDDLLSISRWAQAMAISQQKTYALNFSEDRHAYDLQVQNINEEDGSQENFVAVNGTLGRMHDIPDSINLNTDKDRLEFYPDGSIDDATIDLNSHDQKTQLSTTKIRGKIIEVTDE